MPTNYNISNVDLDSYFLTRANTNQSYNSLPSTLWSWGTNSNGQLGYLYNALGYPPFEDDSFQTMPERAPFPKITNWKTVNMYTTHAAGITTDGNLYVWGRNSAGEGQLGVGSSTFFRASIIDFSYLGYAKTWSKLCEYSMNSAYSTYAIKTDGTLWSWGNNDYGMLGHGDRNHRSVPTQLGATTSNWSMVGCSDQTAGFIRTNGTMWGCGQGEFGNLGTSSPAHRSSPTQVGALTTWSQIGVAWDGGAAIKTDGSIWSWGVGADGALGIWNTTGYTTNAAATTDRSSPIQIGTGTTWQNVAGGGRHFVATTTDGKLWTWGLNNFGNLGHGDLVHRSSPTQVGTLTNWSKPDATYGVTYVIKTDGTLWSWGNNEGMTLGSSVLGKQSSPVQVGGPYGYNDWTSISAAGYYAALGLRSSY